MFERLTRHMVHAVVGISWLIVQCTAFAQHPLDSLSAAEYEAVATILREAGRADDATIFSSIELSQPTKAFVKKWREGDSIPRSAIAVLMIGKDFYRAEIDLDSGSVEAWAASAGQGMLSGYDMQTAKGVAYADSRFVHAMSRRGITDLELLRCTGLASGNFGTPEEQTQRNFKVTCSVREPDSKLYVPVAGVVATVDVLSETVIDFVDTGVVPLAKNPWGHDEEQIREQFGDREGDVQALRSSQAKKVGYHIDESSLSWDIWRMHFGTDDRPGITLNNVEVKDGDSWRSVLYEIYLSEVFVPYSDPSEGWYWRTYMDSGEYGFGDAMTSLTPGVDCPEHATFLDTVSPNMDGTVEDRPGTICIFERTIGDPAWRRRSVGRAATDLVVRYAAAVGNYDYLMDYVFKQDGSIKVMVGASGIDAVKGVAATDTESPTAIEDTRYGTLISPNLVAANHTHFFNFRIDFDVDGEENSFMKARMVPTKVEADVPRTSIWTVQREFPQREKEAVTKIHTASPAYLAIINPNVKNGLKQNPGYVLLPGGSVAHSLLDIKDMPVKRNDYVDNQYWVTPLSPDERFAGGQNSVQSDGNDTLGKWVNMNRPIANTDIVSWYTVGFHHIPRSEDWPVMPSHWVGFTLAPFNFFENNPAINVVP
jgi:primary-amine oxidase